MISDLSLFLAIEHIKRLSDPSVSPEEADQSRQLFEVTLSASNDANLSEDNLFEGYLELDAEDLRGLPPNVHIWFLERLCMSPEPVVSSENAPIYIGALQNIYLLSPHPISRFLVVNALVILEGQLRTEDTSYVQGIWSRISRDTTLPEDAKHQEMEVLADMLLDLWLLESSSERSLQQLLEFERRDHRFQDRRPAASRVKRRADQLGGHEADNLRRLLDAQL